MPRVRGFYIVNTGKKEGDQKCCFICATKAALGADPSTDMIHFVTEKYGWSNCDICKTYIHDEVDTSADEGE